MLIHTQTVTIPQNEHTQKCTKVGFFFFTKTTAITSSLSLYCQKGGNPPQKTHIKSLNKSWVFLSQLILSVPGHQSSVHAVSVAAANPPQGGYRALKQGHASVSNTANQPTGQASVSNATNQTQTFFLFLKLITLPIHFSICVFQPQNLGPCEGHTHFLFIAMSKKGWTLLRGHSHLNKKDAWIWKNKNKKGRFVVLPGYILCSCRCWNLSKLRGPISRCNKVYIHAYILAHTCIHAHTCTHIEWKYV